MYRHRNRPKYSDEEFAKVYSTPYDHTDWPDHIARVEKTIEVGKRLVADKEVPCIADLSCGDAAIALGILDYACHQFGDIRPPEALKDHCSYSGFTGELNFYEGPIEETLDQLDHWADLFILSETLEHLDDPDAVLEKIRTKADKLLLSTPWMQWPDPNPEHYWSWDGSAVLKMLTDAGWAPRHNQDLQYHQPDGQHLGYRYQIWGCV